MSERFKDEFKKMVPDTEAIGVELNTVNSKKVEIVLAEYDDKSLNEIEQMFFDSTPDKIMTYLNDGFEIVDGKDVKTLLIDAPKNGNISSLLNQFPNLEGVVVAVTKGQLFHKNNPEYQKRIFALFKPGNIIYFSSAWLKKKK